MSSQLIFCGLCGYASDSALFQHVREAHNLTPVQYAEQCPNAPLYTEAFRDYVIQHGVHVGDGVAAGVGSGAIRVTRELFGVNVSCAVAPQPLVPAVDEAYHFEPWLAQAVLKSLVEGDRIMLVGPTGAGKSSLVAQLAARANWPMVRANLHGETSAADFLGQHKVRDGSVVFDYGILPTAMKEGRILVVEELDAADPGILFVLQGVLEEQGVLTLMDNGGEVVRPHPHFRLVATANTLGTGDEAGLYAGTQVLNQSHLDRWTAVFQVGYLPEAEEAKLISAKTPALEHSLVDGMVKLAGAVRKAIAEERLYTTFSTRRLLAFARKVLSLGLSRALEVTVLNKLPANDRAIVAELAQRHLPNLENASSS